MGYQYNVAIAATVRPMVKVYSFLRNQSVCFPTLAAELNYDPNVSVDGRFVGAGRSELQGTPVPKIQDTFKSGTGGRTGRAFGVDSGTWFDDWKHPHYDCFGLLMPDSTPGVTWGVHSSSITDYVEDADILLFRGIPGPSSSTARTRLGYSCYLELAHGASDNTNIRVAFEAGQPIRLDYTVDNGGVWGLGVAALRDLGNVERYLEANNGLIRIRTQFDYARGIAEVEIGDGNFLRFRPLSGTLPAPGNLKLSGQNGGAGLWYLPLRAQPLKTTGKIRLPEPHPNAGLARMTYNGLTQAPDGQTTVSVVDPGDGQTLSYTTTATLADAGDGLGSADAPVLANQTLIIPAVWVDEIGAPDVIGDRDLPTQVIDELQIFDDSTQTATSSALVNVLNQYGEFAGAYGHRALDVDVSVGGPFYPRIRGIAGASFEGIDLSTFEAQGRMGLPVTGQEYKMMHGAGQRRIYDGWCLLSAVLREAELGNVHPRFLQTIPRYIPPGGTWEAPYGEAGDDCPFPILEKGTGENTAHEYGPEVSPWIVLQRLVQGAGLVDPATRKSIPYYMGHTLDRQFRFEPYDPNLLTPAIYYSDVDTTGTAYISECHVYNSVAQMRSRIHFQGIDALTYELLVAHLTLPDEVLKAIGFDYPWVERSARYSSELYLTDQIQIAGTIASRPQQIVKVKVPFRPEVCAGMRCFVQEQKSLGGIMQGVIIELRSRYGMRSPYGDPNMDCYSIATVRAINQYPTI